MRISVQQSLGREQDPRDAIAALGGSEIREAFLQGMRPAGSRHAFDRDDLFMLRLNAEHQAGKHRLAINQYGASAALSKLATMLRTREAEVFAQDLQQSFVNLGGHLLGLPIDAKSQEYFAELALNSLSLSWAHFFLLMNHCCSIKEHPIPLLRAQREI
jgi:hypothetical protein